MNKLKPSKKQFFVFIVSIMLSIFLFSINAFAEGVPASTNTGFMKAISAFVKEYKLILNSFIAIAVLTNFLIFIYHFCRLAALSADHPLIRRQSIHNILISGVCLGLMGGAGLVYYIILTIVLK